MKRHSSSVPMFLTISFLYIVRYTLNTLLNFISYSNEKVDEFIETGRREFDPDRRGEIYREMHRYIAEDAPYTFLFFPYATPAIQKRFKGIKPELAGIGYNLIDWYVLEREVKYKF